MEAVEIRKKLKKMKHLFEKHQVNDVFLFGSVLRSDFNSGSDIDLIVNFKKGLDPLLKGELWWSLHDKLREALNREVDLLSESSLKNPVLKDQIESTKVRIYG